MSSTTAVVEVWENQRYGLKGWGNWRLPTDRPSWSDKKGAVTLHKEAYLLPVGWEWSSVWHVEPHGENAEGWYYAADYTISTRFCSQQPSKLSMVRRRKWLRHRRKVESREERNQSTMWNHSIWCNTISYGFNGASEAEQAAQQLRQHHGFSGLHSLLLHDGSTEEQINSSPAVKSLSELERSGEGNYGYASPSPDDPGTPIRTDIAGTPLRLPKRKYLELVYKFGVPHNLRRPLWLRWTGAVVRRDQYPGYFNDLSDRAAVTTVDAVCQEIKQDVVRTAPSHPFFEGPNSPGTLRLTSLLVCLSMHAGLPEYHQAFSCIAAVLLLNMTIEDAFWLMTVVLEHLLPKDYHYGTGLHLDLRILTELIQELYPELEQHFEKTQGDVSVFASGWIQGLFCAHFPFVSAARLFDIMFAEGNTSLLVRVPLAFIKLNAAACKETDGSGSLGQLANRWAREKFDVEDIALALSHDGLGPRIVRRRAELSAATEMAGEEVILGSNVPAHKTPSTMSKN